MSLRRSKFSSILTLAILTGGFLTGFNATTAEVRHGRPIEFSDPKCPEIATNLNQINSRRSGLKDFEVDLTKSFQQGFSSRSSLDGIPEQPARYTAPPVIQSKKARELLDRKKNWAFMAPEDLTSGPTAEEIFNLPDYGPDGKEKKKRSPVELYYDRQEREERAGAGKRERDRESEDIFATHKRAPSRDDADLKDPSTHSEELSDSQRMLRRAFSDSKATDNLVDSSPSADIFRLGNNTVAEQFDPQKAYRKAYREHFEKLLEPSSIVSTAPQVSGLPLLSGSLDQSSAAPVPALDQMQSASRPSVFDSISAGLASPLQPTGVSDPMVKAFGPWNTPSAFPKSDQPKVAPPSSLLDFVPARKF